MKYLRGLLELAPAMPIPATVKDLTAVVGDQPMLTALVQAHSRTPGAQRLAELTGLSSSDYLKVTSELATHLETLNTQGFDQVTSAATFTIDRIWDSQGRLVVVTAPIADQSLSAAAAGLFFGQFLHFTLKSYSRARRPVLLVLDEAPRLQDRIDLGSTLSLVGGAGVSVLLAAQDVTQFHESARNEILANCGTMICLPGVSVETSDYFANRIGTLPSLTVSSSLSSGSGRGRTQSHAFEQRAALGHREISAPPFGPHTGVVHSRSVSSRPFIVDLTRSDLL